MLRCGECKNCLSGEFKKGQVYYRCHITTCLSTGVREERVATALEHVLGRLQLNETELHFVRQWVLKIEAESEAIRETDLKVSKLHLEQLRARRVRLADALLDHDFDRQMFDGRQAMRLLEQQNTFRYTFRSLLDETGARMKMQQELMRHADIRTTMNVYAKAIDESKRPAHGRVVRLVLPSKAA
jgi:integrase